MDTDELRSFALATAPFSAAVARYCDHVEHNEAAEPCWIIDTGEDLCRLALGFAHNSGLDVVQLYAERLGAIESRNVLVELRRTGGGTRRRDLARPAAASPGC